MQLQQASAQSDSLQWYVKFVPAAGSNVGVPEGEPQKIPELDKTVSIQSFSWGASNPATVGSATTGAGTPKVNFKELNILKSYDKATPFLYKNMATGAHYDKVILYGVKQDSAGKRIIPQKIELGTVFTTNIDISGGESSPTTESVNFAYGTAKLFLAPMNPNGTLAPYTQFGWSKITNTPVQENELS